MAKKKESDKHYPWRILGWCSRVNRLCRGYDRTLRNRTSNGWFSFPVDSNTHLELGIACKERLYKSWCSHVAGSCRRKKVRSSDSWNDSHDGSFSIITFFLNQFG